MKWTLLSMWLVSNKYLTRCWSLCCVQFHNWSPISRWYYHLIGLRSWLRQSTRHFVQWSNFVTLFLMTDVSQRTTVGRTIRLLRSKNSIFLSEKAAWHYFSLVRHSSFSSWFLMLQAINCPWFSGKALYFMALSWNLTRALQDAMSFFIWSCVRLFVHFWQLPLKPQLISWSWKIL